MRLDGQSCNDPRVYRAVPDRHRKVTHLTYASYIRNGVPT